MGNPLFASQARGVRAVQLWSFRHNLTVHVPKLRQGVKVDKVLFVKKAQKFIDPPLSQFRTTVGGYSPQAYQLNERGIFPSDSST